MSLAHARPGHRLPLLPPRRAEDADSPAPAPARRFSICVLALLLAGSALPALADIPPAELAQVGVHARAGALLPLDLAFRDQDARPVTLRQALDGEPAVLVFEDYRCNTLCGPALSIVAQAVRTSGLEPGRDLRLLAIGLNPAETPADAAGMRNRRLASDPALRSASSFLTGDATAVKRATAAMGFGYAYDPASAQFTHPVAAFVLTPDGRLARVLPEVNMTGAALRDAVRGAGRGQLGEVADTLALLCHGISVAVGRFDGPVLLGLRAAAVATLAAMALGLTLLMRRRKAA